MVAVRATPIWTKSHPPESGWRFEKNPERKVPLQLKGKLYIFQNKPQLYMHPLQKCSYSSFKRNLQISNLTKKRCLDDFSFKKKSYCSEAERRYTMFATKLAALRRDDIIHGSGNANHLRTRPVNPKKKRMPWKPKNTCLRFFGYFSGQFWRFLLLLKSWKGRIAVLAPQRCVFCFLTKKKKIPFSKCLSTRPRHTSILGCQCFSRFYCTIRSWRGKFTGASWFEDLVAGPLMPHVGSGM